MARYSLPLLGILIILSALAAGCTSPTSSLVTPKETPVIVAPSAETIPVANASAPEPTAVIVSTVTPADTTASTTQIYYKTLAIFMDREEYELINFEDIGYTYLNPGEKYIVRITSDHPIFAYVIRTEDVPRLTTDEGTPVFDKVTRTYEYGRLSPIMKLEDVYEDGAEFTVKDLGKYTLVLDTRLTQKDYHFNNEVDKVTVRILKVD